jgi:hypothetical protein
MAQMPTPLPYEYIRELVVAVDALRDRCRDLRRDSAGLRDYSRKLRAKSGLLLLEGDNRLAAERASRAA